MTDERSDGGGPAARGRDGWRRGGPKPRCVGAIVGIALLWSGSTALAASAHDADDEVDTEHIFGITMGSDIGHKGDLELELETFSGIGKRFGTFFSTGTHVHLKYTVTDNLRIAPGFTFGSHRIRGVPGIEDHGEAGLQEASVEVRYKVLDRHVAPFGLTVNVEPIWGLVDDMTGRRTESYGVVASLLMDKEIIADKLFGAVNLGYSGGTSRLLGTRLWGHDSEVAIHGALSWQVMPNVLIGGEARYLRTYYGMGIDRPRGEALYVGPTFSMRLSKVLGLSGTVNYQVAGKAVGDPASLDLVNYERVQALLRLTAHF